MTEFWENNFIEKQAMWGFEPSKSALLASDFFVEKSITDILIPGIGYGRNAGIFIEKGITVTGIEISKTAIALSEKHFGSSMKIYHGSVTNMPFDNHQYEGIFCYGLIHLLNTSERKKLIHDCYDQLSPNGYMIFTAISKAAPAYGKGRLIEKDRYEIHQGAGIYFYDEESIHQEFGNYGLIDIKEIHENFPFYFIRCQRSNKAS